MKKGLTWMLCLMMAILPCAAAAQTAEAAETVQTAEAAEPILLATVNGASVMSDNNAMSQLVNYYIEYYSAQGMDTTDPSFMAVVKDLGLRWAVDDTLYRQKAAGKQIDLSFGRGLCQDQQPQQAGRGAHRRK